MIKSKKLDSKKYTINVGLQEDFLLLFSAAALIVTCECSNLYHLFIDASEIVLCEWRPKE